MVANPYVLAGLVLASLAACGARSELAEPVLDAGAGGADRDAAPPPRDCFPDCTVGHHCCVGGCDGPAVPLPSDCCVCLPGEVSSFGCANDLCGGG